MFAYPHVLLAEETIALKFFPFVDTLFVFIGSYDLRRLSILPNYNHSFFQKNLADGSCALFFLIDFFLSTQSSF